MTAITKQPPPSQDEVPMKEFYVHAAIVNDGDWTDLHEEDCGAPGYYRVMVPAHMDDGTAAACAMGGFHMAVPIKQLYMFEFSVRNEDDKEVVPGRGLDWYELAEQCGGVYD